MNTLQSKFEAYPNVSLRKLANTTGINYGVLLKKSKEPVPGETYNPDAYNWNALEETLRKKDINLEDLNWDAMNEGPNRAQGAVQKDISAFEIGQEVYLRRNNEVPYVILYKTDTHVVIMLKGSSEPVAWSNNTFLINGPMLTPRASKAQEVAEPVEIAKEEFPETTNAPEPEKKTRKPGAKKGVEA